MGSGYGTNTASEGKDFGRTVQDCTGTLSSICLTIFSVGHSAEV
jgi:hypothetical protein